jgi:cytochrome c
MHNAGRECDDVVNPRNSIAILALVAAISPLSLLLVQTTEESKSVWDGVYTEEQAKRGEPIYRKECASCHGEMLTGGESAPPLTGGAFLANWNGLTVGDLFDRIRKTMPQSAPGRLTRQQNSDILAFMLSANKFPAGKTELYRQSEMLKEIRFESTKPAPKKTVGINNRFRRFSVVFRVFITGGTFYETNASRTSDCSCPRGICRRLRFESCSATNS